MIVFAVGVVPVSVVPEAGIQKNKQFDKLTII
jgi:hypothetical protein